jgi:hypothetical protein
MLSASSSCSYVGLCECITFHACRLDRENAIYIACDVKDHGNVRTSVTQHRKWTRIFCSQPLVEQYTLWLCMLCHVCHSCPYIECTDRLQFILFPALCFLQSLISSTVRIFTEYITFFFLSILNIQCSWNICRMWYHSNPNLWCF